MTNVNKVDSNSTGLRICEEVSIGVLPAAASQVWRPYEPNSYADFGGQIKTVARNPINASRQNRKGVTTDLDASGGFNTDFTKTNLLHLLQGFFFADIREHYDTQPLNGDPIVIDGVVGSTHKYTGANLGVSGSVLANHILFASDFAVTANNDLQVVASVTQESDTGAVVTAAKTTSGTYVATPAASGVATTSANGSGATFDVTAAGSGPYTVDTVTLAAAGTGYRVGDVITLDAGTTGDTEATITVSEVLDDQIKEITIASGLSNETPSTAARLQVVGYQFASGTLNVDVLHVLPRLVVVSGGFDPRTLNLVPGQFIFIGGDSAGKKFVATNDGGWARVKSVSSTYIELDKTTETMTGETGTALTVQIFFGKVLKNEHDKTLIKRRSFQIERDLGQLDEAVAAHQGEYLVGAVANEFTLNVKQADKLNADVTFVAQDHEARTQAQGLKSDAASVSAPDLAGEDAYNTSSHVARLRMTILDPTNANPTPLFAYLTDLTTVVNNNVKPNKAVSVLGAFDLTAGQFAVSGKVTAYFADVNAVSAVRNNADVSLDYIFARDNYGFAYDVPLIALGDGRASVEQDNPVTLPLDMNAAADRVFNHTLLVEYFPYLPDAAMV